jgi:protein gp37
MRSFGYPVCRIAFSEGAMAETQIEWTDASWNPVAGCSEMSAGCTNCYAMDMARRLEAMGVDKYEGLTRRSGKRTVWNGVVREDRTALQIPLGWKKPKKIFVNSMSDLFHDGVSDGFIRDVWAVMEATPQHHYQILTKRPSRMRAFLLSGSSAVLPNVWLGTSIEDAKVAHRVNELRGVRAAIRFISFEPLIGSVGKIDLSGIHWAIVGGESGRAARPIREEWIDEIYDQCSLYDTSFFFKQWGTWGEDNKRRSKKANGRMYRGKTWDAMPQEEAALGRS